MGANDYAETEWDDHLGEIDNPHATGVFTSILAEVYAIARGLGNPDLGPLYPRSSENTAGRENLSSQPPTPESCRTIDSKAENVNLGSSEWTDQAHVPGGGVLRDFSNLTSTTSDSPNILGFKNLRILEPWNSRKDSSYGISAHQSEKTNDFTSTCARRLQYQSSASNTNAAAPTSYADYAGPSNPLPKGDDPFIKSIFRKPTVRYGLGRSGYVMINGKWIDPDSEREVFMASKMPETVIAPVELGGARPKPLFDDDLEEEYRKFTMMVDGEDDDDRDYEGEPLNVRITPQTFLEWTAGAVRSGGYFEESEMPEQASTEISENVYTSPTLQQNSESNLEIGSGQQSEPGNIDRTTSSAHVSVSTNYHWDRPRPQFDEEDGDSMSGTYDNDENPTAQYAPSPRDDAFKPSAFMRSFPLDSRMLSGEVIHHGSFLLDDPESPLSSKETIETYTSQNIRDALGPAAFDIVAGKMAEIRGTVQQTRGEADTLHEINNHIHDTIVTLTRENTGLRVMNRKMEADMKFFQDFQAYQFRLRCFELMRDQMEALNFQDREAQRSLVTWRSCSESTREKAGMLLFENQELRTSGTRLFSAFSEPQNCTIGIGSFATQLGCDRPEIVNGPPPALMGDFRLLECPNVTAQQFEQEVAQQPYQPYQPCSDGHVYEY